MRLMSVLVLVTVGAATRLAAQQPPPNQATAAAALPAATKMEAFRPEAGTVLVFGYDELGSVGGVSVDVRELRDTRGSFVRGLVVEVTESQYRSERSLVDEDEIPELLRGIDALLDVRQNPTQFQNFEVRYTTKGELRITAFSRRSGGVGYSVEAGRTIKAQRFLSESDLRKLRDMFVAAQNKLQSLAR